MTKLNTMKVTFPSRSANESFARMAVAAFVAQLDPTVEELSDLRTAVSEAVTNCIVHAYRDRIGPVTVTADLYEGGTRAAASPMWTGPWSPCSPPAGRSGPAWALR